MRKICIINQKGGVGKTTTTINLATGLARAGKKVLVIDFDPQGNVSDCLGVDQEQGIYEFLVDEQDFDDCRQMIEENLWVMPSKENLTKAELILAGETARELYLKRKLDLVLGFDYVLIDCPPSLGLLNQNALLYSTEAIIPTSTDTLGLDALAKMTGAIKTINEVFGHELHVSAVIPTMHDVRLKTCRESLAEMRQRYEDVVTDPIRVNSKLREAPKQGKDIFRYAKSSRGAQDYMHIVNYVLMHRQLETPLLAEASKNL